MKEGKTKSRLLTSFFFPGWKHRFIYAPLHVLVAFYKHGNIFFFFQPYPILRALSLPIPGPFIHPLKPPYTGRFITFSMNTNIYYKKTKRTTLMELFTVTGKLKTFFFTTIDVRCVHHGWHGTHWHNIQILATHASTRWILCGNNLTIVSICAVSPVVHTSKISSCQKKTFSVFLWLWTIPLMYVLWFYCYICL